MRFKHLTTATWNFVFMGFMCCKVFAQDVSTNAAAPLVRSAGSVTNSATPHNLAFELKPTAIAPAGASGRAQLHPGSISLHVSALGPGVYYLDMVRRSDGTKETLGAITIVDPTSSPSRQATDNKREASANPESVRVETDATLTLPEGLKVQDISRILLMSGDNAVLDSQAK